MNLTASMKKWAVENLAVSATASDDEFKKAISDALVSGKLPLEKFTELSTTKDAEEANEFIGTMKGLSSSVEKLVTAMKAKDEVKTPETKETTSDTKSKVEKKAPEDDEEDEDDAATKGKASDKKEKAVAKGVSMGLIEKQIVSSGGFSSDTDENGEEKSFDVRVKSAAAMYDGTTKSQTYPMTNIKGKPHPLAGQVVKDYSDYEGSGGRVINEPSELDKAVTGAYAQFAVQFARTKSRNVAFSNLPEHSKQLLVYALQNYKWGGASDGGDKADIINQKLTPNQQKALIDDATSGGIEAAPIVFDDRVISAPLLHGEFYPLVNVIPLDRGRRVEGVATGNVTASWGGVDDTAISLFSTTSYVTAFDTTIFRWEGAILLGLDFLSDTPIDFGAHITAQYGERLLEDLDDVICTGNGSTQPEGISVKSGTTSVNFGSATSIGNYESLMFGISAAEIKAPVAASAVFGGSYTSYMRARALPVGASDARRLGGSQDTIGGVSNYGTFNWMGRPYKINESLGNTKIFYAILARYRMYRRRGLTIRTSTEGSTLMRANELLIVATARFGGQLERGACAAYTSTAPS